MRYPNKIEIREVSPRDGLQSEAVHLSVADRITLINMISDAGFRRINAVSFVSPKAVPQMANAEEVAAGITRVPGVIYDASVPNVVGVRRAIQSRMDTALIFVSASDTGSRSNVNRSMEEALEEGERVVAEARAAGLHVTGLVSKAFGSAYEGMTPKDKVIRILRRLVDAGATSLALGDTSGEATPRQVSLLVAELLDTFPNMPLAMHFHDTRGLAMANVLAAMDVGCNHFDGAIGGIGGSPFTKNSSGNLATESLLHFCEDAGIETGVDLDQVLEIYAFLEDRLGHKLPGPLGRVGRSKMASV